MSETAQTAGQQTSQPQQDTTAAATPTGQPQTSQQHNPAIEDGWSDEKFKSISEKYKGDPKEIAKAFWNNSREFTKLQQELAALKKSMPSTTTENSSKSTSEKDAKASDGKEADAQPANGAKDYRQAFSSAYVDVFENGKMSDNTMKLVQEAMGLDAAEASIFAESMQSVVDKRIKQAQAYVETDVKELKKWAEAEGNFTDDELRVIQEALNRGYYAVLKDVEKKYKASQKTTVAHGDGVPTSATTTLTWAEKKALEADPRYGRDRDFTAMVTERILKADKSGWAEEIRANAYKK